VRAPVGVGQHVSSSARRPVVCMAGKGFGSENSSNLPSEDGSAQAAVDVKVGKKSRAETDPEFLTGPSLYDPESFKQIVEDVSASTLYALQQGKDRLEVEFPPLPSTVSDYSGDSDGFSRANLQLALRVCGDLADNGYKPRLVVPDYTEYITAFKFLRPALEQLDDNVMLGSLDDGSTKLRPLAGLNFNALFKPPDLPREEDLRMEAKLADVHVVLNATTTEMIDVEEYAQRYCQDGKVLILFNLNLDTLRGDLGQVAFPSKDLHYRFMSKFLPVYYIRTRNYSKTITAPPYLVNYRGMIFRRYPAPWQVMIQQDNKSYACIAESEDRFTLNEGKEEMMYALGLEEEKGSTLEFLRRGYKYKTWWEENLEPEQSDNWRK